MALTEEQVGRSGIDGFIGYLDITIDSPVHKRLEEARELMRKGREEDPENFDEVWLWCNKKHLEWLCTGPLQHSTEEEWVRVVARDTAIFLLQCMDESLNPVEQMYTMAREQGWQPNMFTVQWAEDQRRMVELLNGIGGDDVAPS